MIMNEEKMQRSDLMDKIKRIQELVKQLNEYRDSYYNEARPVVSDAAYDKLFDELSELEKKLELYMQIHQHKLLDMW